MSSRDSESKEDAHRAKAIAVLKRCARQGGGQSVVVLSRGLGLNGWEVYQLLRPEIDAGRVRVLAASYYEWVGEDDDGGEE